MEDLRVASMVFWRAMFALEPDFANDDTASVTWNTIWRTKLPRTFKEHHHEDVSRAAWQYEGTVLLHKFADTFVKWKEQWVESPAGQAYRNFAEHKRYDSFSTYNLMARSSKTRMTPPQPEWFQEFRWDGETHDGILWGPAQVWEVFGFLGQVTPKKVELTEHQFSPHPPFSAQDSTTASASQEHALAHASAPTGDPTFDQALAEKYGETTIEWFAFDIPAMQAEITGKKPWGHSWYSHLATVCDYTMMLILNLHYGYRDVEN